MLCCTECYLRHIPNELCKRENDDESLENLIKSSNVVELVPTPIFKVVSYKKGKVTWLRSHGENGAAQQIHCLRKSPFYSLSRRHPTVVGVTVLTIM